jgi:hypothetical protein
MSKNLVIVADEDEYGLDAFEKKMKELYAYQAKFGNHA